MVSTKDGIPKHMSSPPFIRWVIDKIFDGSVLIFFKWEQKIDTFWFVWMHLNASHFNNKHTIDYFVDPLTVNIVPVCGPVLAMNKMGGFYSLSRNIFAAQFLKLFDIYEYIYK